MGGAGPLGLFGAPLGSQWNGIMHHLAQSKVWMAMVNFSTLMLARDAPQAPDGAVQCCGLCRLDGGHTGTPG